MDPNVFMQLKSKDLLAVKVKEAWKSSAVRAYRVWQLITVGTEGEVVKHAFANPQ